MARETKKADLFVRIDQEMSNSIDDVAKEIGEDRSTAARLLLREALKARGRVPALEQAHAEIGRRVHARRNG